MACGSCRDRWKAADQLTQGPQTPKAPTSGNSPQPEPAAVALPDTPSAASPNLAPDIPAFNKLILQTIDEMPNESSGGYVWPAPRALDGTTRDLWLGKVRVARAGVGTHCVGATFEAFWRSVEKLPGGAKGVGLDARRAESLKREWFVPRREARGMADALPRLGLGRRILDWDDARPGDFVQMWGDGRPRSWGHAAVFLGWIRDRAGTVVAMRFWSSQVWTEGIGTGAIALGKQLGDADPDRVYLVRAEPGVQAIAGGEETGAGER
ncbi:MAG: hypothetical protein ACOYOB_17075 [Myxococcota bacterium]